jgi:uncharacterized membrane protein
MLYFTRKKKEFSIEEEKEVHFLLELPIHAVSLTIRTVHISIRQELELLHAGNLQYEGM